MAQIVVRNIPDKVMENLKAAAKAAGKSTEQIAREALAEAARKQDVEEAWARVDAIRARTKRTISAEEAERLFEESRRERNQRPYMPGLSDDR